MVIKKGSTEYTIIEQRECWIVSRKTGNLSVEYKIPKDICENEDSLKKYIAKEEMF